MELSDIRQRVRDRDQIYAVVKISLVYRAKSLTLTSFAAVPSNDGRLHLIAA
jgi:hypothetical protein